MDSSRKFRRTTDLDIVIGRQLKDARRAKRHSQSVLADRLGITFQQIQKYERGSNRISATTLFHAAVFLDVPMAFFFENAPQPERDTEPSKDPCSLFAGTNRGLKLYETFMAAPINVQDEILALLSAISSKMQDIEI